MHREKKTFGKLDIFEPNLFLKHLELWVLSLQNFFKLRVESIGDSSFPISRFNDLINFF